MTDVIFGATTALAVSNFPVSGWTMPKPFLTALARIKKAAATVHAELGLLDAERSSALKNAAEEVISGLHWTQFPVDVFQTGSGTSTNMNMNEVIATRAQQILHEKGELRPVHPNDHANMGQSSNDTIPSAAHIALASEIRTDLLPALGELAASLAAKKNAWDDIIKVGRTHLQDATPIRLGQVFAGYEAMVKAGVRRIAESASSELRPVALGGTAVGTGINTHPAFARMVLALVTKETGIPFREAENHCAAQASAEGMVRMAGELKTLALGLMKIANDIRFLSSGPRCGYEELLLPSLQPGSSIMPGKVNPVACESLMQAASFVCGSEGTVACAALSLSNFELSIGWPVMIWSLLESVRILSAASRNFSQKALEKLEANTKQCEELAELSLSLATPLALYIGYDRAAEVAKRAGKEGKTVREVAKELVKEGFLTEEQLEKALDLRSLTFPSAPNHTEKEEKI